MNRRGSILLEGVLALGFLIIPGTAFQLELIRAAQNHIVLHAATFHYVRLRALGEPHGASVAQQTKKFSSLLPLSERRQFLQSDSWESWPRRAPSEIWGRVKIRYSTWFPFLQTRRQITKLCWFSW